MRIVFCAAKTNNYFMTLIKSSAAAIIALIAAGAMAQSNAPLPVVQIQADKIVA
jgi:hypothetical protein